MRKKTQQTLNLLRICVLKIEFDVVTEAYSCQPLHKSTQP